MYKIDNDYSYIDPVYFEEFEELIDEIILSDKQWLIFVERTKTGQELTSLLNSRNCKTVFVSSAVRNKIKGGVKDTLKEIAESENFSCKVLISTSVLDCGINIKNSNISNIVIEQSEKTEFLQMLGRLRVSEGERIKLFIKAFSLQRIQQLINQTEQKLYYMSKYYNEDIDLKLLSTTKGSSVSNLLYDTRHKEKRANISITAYIYCLYALKDYIEAKANSMLPIRSDFFIRQQLKWLGKEYDFKCWYRFDIKIQNILNIINETKDKEFLDLQDQNEFSKKIIECIIDFPEVFLEKNIIRFKNEYIRRLNSEYYAKKKLCITNTDEMSIEERILPKKSFLNKCFKNLSLPYKIESKQKTKQGKRMTYWQICDE